MLRTEAVATIQQTLGFRSDKATQIVTALQQAQAQLERSPTLPWFLLTEVTSVSTVADEERVPVPCDMLREWHDDPLWYFNGTAPQDADKWVPLAKDSLKYLREIYPGEGTPIAYSIDKLYFRIFPTPDAIYTLKQIYFKEDELLTSDIENDWLKYMPELVIGKAGRKLAIGLRDQIALQEFKVIEAEAQRVMRIENFARFEATRNRIMGGPD